MNNQTIHELDEAIRLNPEDAAGYINRGYAYYKKGGYEQAIEDYDSAVRLALTTRLTSVNLALHTEDRKQLKQLLNY